MTNHRSHSRSRGLRRSRSGRNSHAQRSVSSRSSHAWCRFKFKETNYGAALCSMSVIVLVFTALSEPRWIYMEGGGCNHEKSSTLGANQFFYLGKFIKSHSSFSSPVITAYKYGATSVMINCVTYSTVLLFKTIIAFSFVVIFFTLGAFLLDLTGPSRKALKVLRRNGFLSILSVILCVLINFLCYCITVQVEKLQKDSKTDKNAEVYVTFDISFYLIAAAGGMSGFAVAFNCLRKYPMRVSEHQDMATLLNDYDNMTTVGMPESPEVTPGDEIPELPPLPPPSEPSHPPPAYTP